ncbi:putative RNA modification enzyme NFACT subunit A [Candidatus Mancarchaeum acidiphilum]|uniref:Putative RNA modification enzyme NFACT subunit A n=1 Tax=Candidatus Mancarchaeum acidiphilum TaxID=1920749 RepID=A0A218NML9_9ARCH|nr:NFACT family protein [Candidatus Mancarchaeum acidiphilum]ASI13701.1 putative RNA modification enzyme NFACT subunit A [Candidatus Mancarchaeum acidiphilum]
MRQLSTLEITAVIEELKNVEGMFVDKFYLVSEDEFRLKLSRTGEKVNISCKLCYSFNKTKYLKSADNHKSTFESAVRKRLNGTHVEEISQINDDRIIKIGFAKGETKKYMIIEMFAKGNMIVADDQSKIELAYKQHEFKDRKIRVNEIYKPPEKAKITITDAIESRMPQMLNEILSNADGSQKLIKFLNSNVNIGLPYIEDSILECGADPNSKLSEINESMLSSILDKIHLKTNLIQTPQPIIYFDAADGILDFAICPLIKYKDKKSQTKSSISEMLDDVNYGEGAEQAIPKVNEKAEEAASSVRKQMEIIESMKERVEYDRRAGKKIFENMAVLNEVLEFALSQRHITLEDLKSKFPYLNITGIDLKDKTITVDL